MVGIPYDRFSHYELCVYDVYPGRAIPKASKMVPVATLLVDQLANLHFHYTSVPRYTHMTD